MFPALLAAAPAIAGALGGGGGDAPAAPAGPSSDASAPVFGGVNFKGTLNEAARTTNANARTNDPTQAETASGGEKWIWVALAVVGVIAAIVFLRPASKSKKRR